jgi:hypothetical protein
VLTVRLGDAEQLQQLAGPGILLIGKLRRSDPSRPVADDVRPLDRLVLEPPEIFRRRLRPCEIDGICRRDEPDWRRRGSGPSLWLRCGAAGASRMRRTRGSLSSKGHVGFEPAVGLAVSIP